jgi:hypothetical protein
MDTLGAIFVTIGALCVFFFWPAGIALMVIGLVLCILSARSPRLRRGPICPACHGALGDQEPQICPDCRTRLFWTHDGNPLTREQFQAYAHRERIWAKDRAQKAEAAEARAIERGQRREAWFEWTAETTREVMARIRETVRRF